MFSQYFENLLFHFRKFRLSWDSNVLGTCTKTQSSSLEDESSAFKVRSNLFTGWYMVEIKITLPTTRVIAVVMRDPGQGNCVETLSFALHSGRTCKRLIYIGIDEQVGLRVPLPAGTFDLQHFRLLRVTKKFATSRMLQKLRALHPKYKAKRARHGMDKSNLDSSATLPILWTDYCALFEEAEEIFPYLGWVNEFDVISDSTRIHIRARVEALRKKPLISILMPAYNSTAAWLDGAVASVSKQLYPHWELCIADDASTDPNVRLLIERWAGIDSRVKTVFSKVNSHISAASNDALAMARGEWVALLDHDDVLTEDALYWIADAINRHPDCRLIYSDEDKIDETGIRSDPYFKCDWNTDLFYSQNMFSHLGVYHAALVREVGGFRLGLEGSQDYDLALRCLEKIKSEQIHHIPRVLYHWRMHADSTAQNADAKPYAMIAGARALNDHFERQSLNAHAEPVGYGYRVRYVLPEVLPLVSLIIPTRNKIKLLRQCVNSIVEKTSYSNYELIIIDNGSDDRATLRYLEELSQMPRVRVMRNDQPFNYSALNNSAVKVARGEMVGLVNNDVEVISPDWLGEMVSHALRPEVGAVGARLWYSDDTLQHAGVMLGIHGVAGHVHRYLPRGSVGYCGRAALIQSFSAVTGACLVVRKSSYEAVGGLNEVELQVACNDIDFCLKLREAGYRNIYTPYAELYHHESASRGFDDTPEKMARSAKEVAYIKQRWGDILLNDPAYSPNLTLDAEDFSLAWPPRVPGLTENEATTV
jgi:O-antigen biosynthesis protein